MPEGLREISLPSPSEGEGIPGRQKHRSPRVQRNKNAQEKINKGHNGFQQGNPRAMGYGLYCALPQGDKGPCLHSRLQLLSEDLTTESGRHGTTRFDRPA